MTNEHGMSDAEIVMDFLEWLNTAKNGYMGLAYEGQPEPYVPTDPEDLERLESLIAEWTKENK